MFVCLFIESHGLRQRFSNSLPFSGDSASWDFGKGAGFYVDATAPPWNQHYRMYSYVTDELPALIHAHFPQVDATRQARRSLHLQFCPKIHLARECAVFCRAFSATAWVDTALSCVR